MLLADFARLRCWAVLGASADRAKYGNKIYRDLRAAGYRVYAVNPRLSELEGDPCYASLAALPETPDVVDFVTPPAVSEALMADCVAAGVRRVWFQPGADSPAALAMAREAGLQVVSDACIMIQKHAWDAPHGE